jgi:hypothetical protein
MEVEHTDSEPFRKSGKVLDESEYNQIADTAPEAVESAIVALRKSGFDKTAELIEAKPAE